jgi:uncharacterized membrane protein
MRWSRGQLEEKFMRALQSTVFGILISLIGVACSGSSSDSNSNTNNSGTVDCSTGTTPKFSELTALKKCTSCHATSLSGVDRSQAPSDVNFDTYSEAKLVAGDAVSEINEGAMPPAGAPKLTADEATAIKRWAACGTPQ